MQQAFSASKKMADRQTTYHELDSQTISAFLSILKDAGFQPDNRLECNHLYHCRTDKKQDRRFAWYKIGYSKDERAFVGSYGSFTLDTQRAAFPVYEPLTPKEQAAADKRRAEQERQDAERAAKQAAKEQQDAERAAKQAAKTAELAKRLLDAGTSDGLPEYLVNKNLPLVAPAKAIAGRDLLRLLPITQGSVKAAVLRVSNQSTRLFLLVPVYQHSGELSNVQIILPEKVDIHSDGKAGNKLFLAGKGTLRGAYLALTPLSDVPNGSELLIFEGYAKAIPAYLLGKPCIIAFFVGNIDNVAKLFAPADYPNKDAWQACNKAHTWPRRFTVKNCADNDAAALTTAKKIKWRVKSVFPVFPGVKDWDDLYRVGGLEEVKRQLDEPRHLNAAYHALTPEQFISDLKLSHPDGISWLISDTGNGKTQEVCRYANENPHEMVFLIAPTNGICFQTAHGLKKDGKPFQLVMGNMKVKLPLSYSKDFSYDCAGLTVTTLKSFVEKFDFSRCLYPVTLFLDEAHGLSEDIYRQPEIMRLYAMLPNARKAVLLTATPHFSHGYGLQAAPKIFVKKAGKPPTRCKILYYPKQELAVIRHFAEQGRVIAEMNSLSGMASTAKTLRKQGFSGVYTLSADDKFTPDSIFWHIMLHERLPEDCRILLTTKLYETGLNIRDTDIKTVLTFPVKPLNIRTTPEAILTPHSVKQVANRTRNAAPAVYYCLPECARNENSSAFNGAYHYKRFERRAERQRAEYLAMIRDDGKHAALASFNGEMRENAPRLLTWQDDAPEISRAGIDLSVCEQYQAALLYSGNFLRAELNAHSLQFDGECLLAELTDAAECSKSERADLQAAAAETQEEEAAKFLDDVVRLSQLSDKDLQHDDSRHAPKMAYLRQMATPNDAAALLLNIGKEARAFSQVKKRLTVLKAMANAAKQKKRLETAAALMAFLRRDTFTGKEAAECVTAVFENDRVLNHELDKEWRTGTTRRMKEKRALTHLRAFKDISKKHTENGMVYAKTDNAPILNLWKNTLGKTPFSDGFFRKWFFEKTTFSGCEMPVSVGDTPDTLQNKSVYSTTKTNVSGLNDLQVYLASEMSDFVAVAPRIEDEERAAIAAYGG